MPPSKGTWSNTFKDKEKEYVNAATEKATVHFWELPQGLCVSLSPKPPELKTRGKTGTVRIGRLLKLYGESEEIEKRIEFLLNWRNKKHKVLVKFPLSLKNESYVKLYSLMVSEGSYNTEFKLQVPEDEFHSLFADTLNELFRGIRIIVKNGKVPISRAPRLVRYLLPFERHIPRFILESTDFARTYLRIAFEAEGSLHLIKTPNGTHRRIKLSRNVGIDELITTKLKYRTGERIYKGVLEKEAAGLLKKIWERPCTTIFGEGYMLMKHFGIEARIAPEYLRANKNPTRRGKVSVKWTLTIHGENINRFINQIGFISEKKKKKAIELLKVNSRKKRGFAYEIVKKVQRNGRATRQDFIREMRKEGYKEPAAFLSRYKKEGKLKRIGQGEYAVAEPPL